MEVENENTSLLYTINIYPAAYQATTSPGLQPKHLSSQVRGGKDKGIKRVMLGFKDDIHVNITRITIH